MDAVKVAMLGTVLGYEAQKIKNFIPQYLLAGKDGYRLFLFVHRIVGQWDDNLHASASTPKTFAEVPLEFIEFYGLPAMLASKAPLTYFYTWLLSMDAHAILLFVFEHSSLAELKEASCSVDPKLENEYERLIRLYLTKSSTLYMWNLTHYFHPNLEHMSKSEMLERLREGAFMTLGDYFTTFWHGKEPLMQKMCDEIGLGNEIVSYSKLKTAFEGPLEEIHEMWYKFRKDNNIDKDEQILSENNGLGAKALLLKEKTSILRSFLRSICGFGWETFQTYHFLGVVQKSDKENYVDPSIIDFNFAVCEGKAIKIVAKGKANLVTIRSSSNVIGPQMRHTRKQSVSSVKTAISIKPIQQSPLGSDTVIGSPITNNNAYSGTGLEATLARILRLTNDDYEKEASTPSMPAITTNRGRMLSEQSLSGRSQSTLVQSPHERRHNLGNFTKLLGNLKHHQSGKNFQAPARSLSRSHRSRDNLRETRASDGQQRPWDSQDFNLKQQQKLESLQNFFGLEEDQPTRKLSTREKGKSVRRKNPKELVRAPDAPQNRESPILRPRESHDNLQTPMEFLTDKTNQVDSQSPTTIEVSSVYSANSMSSSRRRPRITAIYQPSSSNTGTEAVVRCQMRPEQSNIYQAADGTIPRPSSSNFTKAPLSYGSTSSLPYASGPSFSHGFQAGSQHSSQSMSIQYLDSSSLSPPSPATQRTRLLQSKQTTRKWFAKGE